MFLAAVLRSHSRENFKVAWTDGLTLLPPFQRKQIQIIAEKPFIPPVFWFAYLRFLFFCVWFSLVRAPFHLCLYNNENISDLSGRKQKILVVYGKQTRGCHFVIDSLWHPFFRGLLGPPGYISHLDLLKKNGLLFWQLYPFCLFFELSVIFNV